MLILVFLGMYFDAVVVFVTSQTLLFRLALTILCTLTYNPVKLLNQRSFTCSNAFGTIDQNHGYNRHIPFGFDSLVVIGQMLEQRFVIGIENKLEKKQ